MRSMKQNIQRAFAVFIGRLPLSGCSKYSLGLIFISIFALVDQASSKKIDKSSPAKLSLSQADKTGIHPICPLQTTQQWQAFIDQNATDPRWLTTCEDSLCDAESFRFVEEKIQKTFDVCEEFLSQNPKIQECTNRFYRFSIAWLNQHDDNSYGFAMDNPSYLAEQESNDKPEGMMDPPSFLVDALPKRNEVESAARRHGLKSLTHDSALGGTRTYVLYSDPQDRFDQWLLLNLNDESPDLKDGTPLSVLTVQKRDRAGQVLKKIKVHFRDYQIAHDKRNRYTLELDQSANGKCYACHSNGVRELIARHTPVLQAEPLPNEMLYSKPQDFAYQRLLEFNRRLRSYGSPDWDHKIHRDDHGPILGAEQGCTDCHNNQSRGSLSVSTSPAQIKRKILEDLTMPPVAQAEYLLEQEQLHNISNPAIGQSKLSDLREKHRRILDDYEKSRLPTLTKWLKEVPCESGSQL